MSRPPTYTPLPTSELDADEESSLFADEDQLEDHYTTNTTNKSRTLRASSRSKKHLAFVLLSLAVVMTALVRGAQHLVRGFRMRGCHTGLGGSRNQSTKFANGGGLTTHFTLPSGDKIPSVALGVWRAEKNLVGTAVKAALNVGYRHIDGAWIYGNEHEVGNALKANGIARDKVWLTSKLWNTFHAPEDVEPTLDESLARLGVEYLDLYLIHWPVAFYKDGKKYDRELTANPYPTWQKLEEMVEKGKVRNIGVSNFNIPRLKNLTANPLKVKPAVNQVELNFWNPQPELLKWSKENGILLEAYSPLGSAEQVKKTLAVPEIKEIAAAQGMTPAQVIISWHVQRGSVVLPKSVHCDRVKENFQVAALPQDAFDKLEKAATSHAPQRVVNPSKSWGLDFDVFDD
ncbi:hypothetical protein HGRIS_005533 [Hohenbuehelia grisea]|uniref:NADP-dependent oxidoreductase domain-containing protein n=1 Tax=Hohenbuehelia grisea TaxID=104357 RepID=A0ABR3JYL0_9AGAR